MKKILVTILIIVAMGYIWQAANTAKGEGCNFTRVMTQNNSEVGINQARAKEIFENIELENLTIETIEIETIEIETIPISCGQARYQIKKPEPRPWIEDVFDWLTFWD